MANLTSANSALTIQIAGLYPAPQSIQGYAVDDAFAVDSVKKIEAMMGVDGKLSAGFTPAPKILHISLQADSAANQIFDNWDAAQEAGMTPLECNVVISAPSLGAKYILTKGFFTDLSPMPDAKKVFQPRKYSITFESMSKAPF